MSRSASRIPIEDDTFALLQAASLFSELEKTQALNEIVKTMTIQETMELVGFASSTQKSVLWGKIAASKGERAIFLSCQDGAVVMGVALRKYKDKRTTKVSSSTWSCDYIFVALDFGSSRVTTPLVTLAALFGGTAVATTALSMEGPLSIAAALVVAPLALCTAIGLAAGAAISYCSHRSPLSNSAGKSDTQTLIVNAILLHKLNKLGFLHFDGRFFYMTLNQ